MHFKTPPPLHTHFIIGLVLLCSLSSPSQATLLNQTTLDLDIPYLVYRDANGAQVSFSVQLDFVPNTHGRALWKLRNYNWLSQAPSTDQPAAFLSTDLELDIINVQFLGLTWWIKLAYNPNLPEGAQLEMTEYVPLLQGIGGTPGAPGQTGAAGANGKTVLNGKGAPLNNLGTDGDFYLDTRATALYGPKTANNWGNPTALIGPAGETGPAGTAGAAGAKGDKGDPGATGAKGDKGEPGVAGADGAPGPQGIAGINGKTLLNGTAAPTSTAGTEGDFYIDTTAKKIYGPKASGAWPTTAISLVGTQGPAGSSGGTGPAGPAGANGQGVPAGGTTGQVLSKTDGTDYTTQWTTLAAGGDMQKSTYDTDNNSKVDKDKIAADLAISGGTVDNSSIGATTASTGKFTTLETGTLKVTTGAGTAGQVLTSDAAGIATWATPASGWGLTGNTGTTAGTNFIGTTDNQGLTVKTNGQQVLFISAPHVDEKTPNIVAGYINNSIGAPGVIGSVIAGGGALYGGTDDEKNTIYDNYCVISGGTLNTCGNNDSNIESAFYSVVGGGYKNTASGTNSAVAGGSSNTASGYISTVAGGSKNTASGYVSTVAGGYLNTAAGAFSFAAGKRVKIDALHDGSFLFADSITGDFNSAAADEFAVRATGGVRLVTAVDLTDTSPADGVADNPISTAGVTLSAGGGAWNSISDRAKKENFAQVNPQEVLEKVVALPIETWNYKTQDDNIRHIGPMAQDFRAAFGLGEDDKTISTVDPDGVALAAIQGLYARVTVQQTEIEALKAQNQQMRERLARLEAALVK